MGARQSAASLASIVAIGCLLLVAQGAQAAVLKADYQFTDTLTSDVLGAPPLTHVGTCPTPDSYASELANGITDRVLTFAAGCGLQLASSTVISPSTYSIVLRVRIDDLSNVRRLFDPAAPAGTDTGLFAFFTRVGFGDPNSFNPFAFGQGSFPFGEYSQVVLTRDGATKEVVGYLNGKREWSFIDATDVGVIATAQTPTFLIGPPGSGQDPSGAVARLRLYDAPLTPAEVGALDGTPPVGVKIIKPGTGQGTVTSSPPGIDCGTSCTKVYPFGTTVTLTAAPAARTQFAGFSGGGCSGTALTCTVTADQFHSVSATFTRDVLHLAVTKVGNGAGTVNSTPAGINCGLFCSGDFPSFENVTLTADPAPGTIFAGFSGAGCVGSAKTCTVFLDDARSVTATFTRDQKALTVTRDGTGAGRVTSIPAGINCGAECVHVFDAGTQVLLVADPAAGSQFDGFGGAGCTGTSTRCFVSMDQAHAVTATFSPRSTSLAAGAASAPGPAPSAALADTTRPILSGLTVTPAQFAIGSLLPRLGGTAAGSTIRFSLSEPGTVRLSFARRLSGRRVGTTCRADAAGLRRRPACTRYVAVAPSVTIQGAQAGTNEIHFQGRLSRTRALAPGRYRLTVVATDAAGNRSRSATTLLTARRQDTSRAAG